MRTNVLLTKLRMEEKEFVTSDELKAYCKSMKLDYKTVVRYFESRSYLTRLFRGIFYISTLDELKLNKIKYNHLELVAKAMELKKVRNWYFGLHTALKLNNMTHETFTIEEVVSDSVFRSKPMKIAGHSFKFVKLVPSLLEFGTVEENSIRHSDPEKTILDFIYLWRYNGIPAEKIAADISEWAKGLSRSRLARYSRSYPTTVMAVAERVVE